MMTDAQKEARAAKAAAAKAEAARKRSIAIEAQFVKDLASLGSVSEEKARIFDYIGKEIASGRRSEDDVKFLRQTRGIHFREASRTARGKKEATDA